jgi:hypothetical protein
VSAASRFYHFGQVPPGPHYDEASKIFDALDVLSGHHTPFSLRPYGREMLHVYLALPLVLLLGPTYLALRLVTAVVGILTPLAIYLFVQELLGERDRRLAQWTGLLGAMLFAVSFWALAVNRIGFRANYVPLFETLCFLFFWRAVRTDRWWEYALSGLFLGLVLNTYTSSRFVPGVLLLFVAGWALSRTGRALILRRWRGWLVLIGMALLLFAPLLIFFLTHPGTFMMRAGALSLFNPVLNKGDVWGLVGRSVLGSLGLFGFTGDPNWVFNIPGRPAVDVVPAVLFWLGAVLCLLRWRQPRYAFLLVWWLVMLLPGILAPDPIPHFLRTFGALPAACVIGAVSATELISFLARRFRRFRTAIPVAGGICLLLAIGWTGYRTWHDYFDVWAQSDEVYYAYNGYMADLARQMDRDTDQQAVYVVPINYDRRGEVFHEYTLELLHRGSVPFHYIIVDDATVARDLTDIAAGKRTVRLVVWTRGDHVDADPRAVLPFLLQRFGQQVDAKDYRGYRIVSYELPSRAVDFSASLGLSPMQASFANGLRLVEQADAPGAASGDPAWVALRWLTAKPLPTDYKASLRLLDPGGHLVGQSDTLLLSNEHRPSSGWEPGEEVTTYHLVPSLPGTMPGPYRLALVLYDPATLLPQGLVDLVGAPAGEQVLLGALQVGRPLAPGVAKPKAALQADPLAPGLTLTGYDLDHRLFSPGDAIHLALYWRTLATPSEDYGVAVQLLDGNGQNVAEWDQPPLYPTAQWRAGDVWRDWHVLPIPPDLTAGTYDLRVALTAQGALSQPAVSLTLIDLQGRPHRFDVPVIEHPLGARLGESVEFLGYDLSPTEVAAGESLRLTLYWRALSESRTSYTVFTHLLSAAGELFGQSDGVPGAGSAPTTSWVPNEVLVDEYQIRVDPGALPGEYTLEIGMYDATTSQRLPVSRAGGASLGDRLLLDTLVQVR